MAKFDREDAIRKIKDEFKLYKQMRRDAFADEHKDIDTWDGVYGAIFCNSGADEIRRLSIKLNSPFTVMPNTDSAKDDVITYIDALERYVNTF